jgi:hypothetical protein
MTQLDPANTTIGDLVLASLKLAGVIGVGQSASAEDSSDAWALAQWMLQEWQRKRWLIFALATFSKISTGAVSYTLGPGGDFDTGADSFRPDKIESAFLRQLTQSQPNQVDFPLEILQAKEDYNRIALKTLSSFPTSIFYDPQWPLGVVYAWPVPQNAIYGLYVTIKVQTPFKFAALATVLNIPYEYYNAIVFNLAIRLRAKYSIPSFPGDTLPGLAKDALNTLRGGNTAIARLSTADVNRPGQYNIFNDRFY